MYVLYNYIIAIMICKDIMSIPYVNSRAISVFIII